MVQPLKKTQAKRLSGNRTKDFFSRIFKCPLGTLLSFIGLAGMQDDLATWLSWLDKVTREERILALAEQAVGYANWVNQPEVRVTFFVLGVILLMWRLPWVWRLRHRFIFAWRSAVSEEVWVSKASALQLLRNSQWGQLKRPSTSILDFGKFGASGMTEGERAQSKYSAYIELALDAFEQDNPNSVRDASDGSKEYGEGAIRKFSISALRDEIEVEFGPIPRGTV